MAKALELLRDQPAAAGVLARFSAWVDDVMMPQMDFYSDEVTPVNLGLGTKHLYGEWRQQVQTSFCIPAVAIMCITAVASCVSLLLHHVYHCCCTRVYHCCCNHVHHT
jgi:hypothetical protein